MYQNILMLDDGTQIRAGPGGSAIQSIIYTSTVESETDLTPGAACSGKIEFVIWVQPGTNLVLRQAHESATISRMTPAPRSLSGRSGPSSPQSSPETRTRCTLTTL